MGLSGKKLYVAIGVKHTKESYCATSIDGLAEALNVDYKKLKGRFECDIKQISKRTPYGESKVLGLQFDTDTFLLREVALIAKRGAPRENNKMVQYFEGKKALSED